MDDQTADTTEGTPGAISGSWWVRDIPRLRGYGWKRILAWLVGLVGTLAVLTSNLNLLFDPVLDGCREIGICDALPPPVLVGTLSEVRVGAAHLTLREAYLDGNASGVENVSPEDLEWPGQLITYRVEFQGLEKATCSVKWTLYDANTGRRVPNGTSTTWKTVHALAFPNGRWTVEAYESDVIVGLIWVPYVAEGTFVVEIELVNESGARLDLERSGEFEVSDQDVPDPVAPAPTQTLIASLPARMNPGSIHGRRKESGC